MRWLLLLVAGCGSDFQETIYVHLDDAQMVTLEGTTYSSDFQVDRTFSSDDDAEAAPLTMDIRFQDGHEVTGFIGTRCPQLMVSFDLTDRNAWESSLCSYYLVNQTDSPSAPPGPGMNWDCSCTDSRGNAYGNSSSTLNKF